MIKVIGITQGEVKDYASCEFIISDPNDKEMATVGQSSYNIEDLKDRYQSLATIFRNPIFFEEMEHQFCFVLAQELIDSLALLGHDWKYLFSSVNEKEYPCVVHEGLYLFNMKVDNSGDLKIAQPEVIEMLVHSSKVLAMQLGMSRVCLDRLMGTFNRFWRFHCKDKMSPALYFLTALNLFSKINTANSPIKNGDSESIRELMAESFEYKTKYFKNHIDCPTVEVYVDKVMNDLELIKALNQWS